VVVAVVADDDDDNNVERNAEHGPKAAVAAKTARDLNIMVYNEISLLLQLLVNEVKSMIT
jgi:hypothetical protein